MNDLTTPTATATAADWAGFLRPLLLAVANPPGRDDYADRCRSIAFAMPAVYRDMLTPWRQSEALRRYKFFPTPAEIAEWLEPDLADRRRTRAALAAPVQAPPPPKPTQRTPEELEAVREAARRLSGDVRAGPDDAHPPVKALYLSDGQLLATYERLVNAGGPLAPAAQIRVDMLRAKAAAREAER